MACCIRGLFFQMLIYLFAFFAGIIIIYCYIIMPAKKNKAKKLKNINTVEQLTALNKHIADKNNHVFVLVFMENCGPCMETRPEWDKLASENKGGSVVIADVNSALLNDGVNTIQHMGQV